MKRKTCQEDGGLFFLFLAPPLNGKGKLKTYIRRAVLRENEPHVLRVRGINPSSDNQSYNRRKELNCDDTT